MMKYALLCFIACQLSHSLAHYKNYNHITSMINATKIEELNLIDDDDNSTMDPAHAPLFSVTGYPDFGDIPLLNRKMFRAHRVTAQENPYVVSIRRNFSHYLTGALVKSNLVISVAHPLRRAPVHELGIVASETYNDRGTAILTVLLVMTHLLFDPYTLENDLALLLFYESININSPYRGDIKLIQLARRSAPLTGKGLVSGWGRCDLTGNELCLPRSSEYYPHEPVGPMLRSVRIDLGESPYCQGYNLLGLKLAPGMLCVGQAREQEATAACLAVPGAPLVARGKLLGIASWGFGCGFKNDLPLVYTDMRKYRNWFHTIESVFKHLAKADFTELYLGTKAYIFYHILAETRVDKKKLTHQDGEESLTSIPLDRKLVKLVDYVKFYDVRDYVHGRAFHDKKKYMYRQLAQTFRQAMPPINFGDTRVERNEL